MKAVLARRQKVVSRVRTALRYGSDYHAPTPEQMRGAVNNWPYMHTHSVIGWFPAESNTTYETELARISKELGWDSETAFLPAPELCTEERRYWQWNDNIYHMAIGFCFGLMPFMNGTFLIKSSLSFSTNFFI